MRGSSLLVVLVFGVACGDAEPNEDEPGGSPVPDGGCWWCVDGSASGGAGGATGGAGGKGVGGKGTGGKGVGGKAGAGGGKGDYDLWLGSIDVTKGTGSYTYAKSVAGTECEIKYALDDYKDLPPCSNCEFAKFFTLGTVTSSHNEAKCPDGAGKTGASFIYAHGKLSDPSGKARQLLEDQQGKWVEVGTSSFASGKPWTFFVTPQK